jgi:phosphoglycolate phosphatase-like HAD superfamily hydrolase
LPATARDDTLSAAVKIILFDVDGTLLSTAGATREVFARALSEAGGRPVNPDGYSFSGKTDPQIARDILALHGVEGERLEAAVPEAIRLYLAYFADALPRLGKARILPGVRELLDSLVRRDDACTALLTGNMEEGARIKLGHFDLTRYFDFSLSCFGSDHEDRYRLPELALERARRRFGPEVSGGQLVIVGDSEHDVLCGRSVGARSVAVGTGWTPLETLRDLKPHALLEDLSDTERALGAILAN